MKKSLILFVSMMTIGAASYAQTSFGFTAGVNNSFTAYKVDGTGGDPDEKYEGSTTGFQIGGVAHVPLSTNFAFRPNLLFTMRGGAIESYKISTMNIEVPLNFVYTTNNFFFGAGPNFSMGLSGKIKDVPGGDLDIYNKDEAGEYTLKKFEVGANVTMGYQFPGGFTLTANYTPGLTDIYEGDGGSSEVKANSKFFGFSLGYMFGGGTKKKK